MSILKKSIIRPWLDASDDLKFVKGIPGVSVDKWVEQPNLSPCWKGATREWHIKDGMSYQNQLKCPIWGCYINPSGFTCELCKNQVWPNIENYRVHILPPLNKTDKAEAILTAVKRGSLSEEEGIILGKEFDLE